MQKGALEFIRHVVDGRMGYISSVRDDIPNILGRPATTLREWAVQQREELVLLAE